MKFNNEKTAKPEFENELNEKLSTSDNDKEGEEMIQELTQNVIPNEFSNNNKNSHLTTDNKENSDIASEYLPPRRLITFVPPPSLSASTAIFNCPSPPSPSLEQTRAASDETLNSFDNNTVSVSHKKSELHYNSPYSSNSDLLSHTKQTDSPFPVSTAPSPSLVQRSFNYNTDSEFNSF